MYLVNFITVNPITVVELIVTNQAKDLMLQHGICGDNTGTVSYTHLTLPTICSV